MPDDQHTELPTNEARGRIDWIAIAGLALVALFLLPGRLAAFRGDDTWTSETNGERQWLNEGAFQQLRHAVDLYFQTGRPSVLGTVEGSLGQWTLGNHPVLAKLMILGLLVAATYGLYRLVLVLGGTALTGLLTLLLFAGAVQFRSFHDGSLGYWGVSPTVMLFLLLSLVLFGRWLRTGGRWLWLASFAMFVATLFMYEGTYPFCLIFLALALFERRGLAAWRVAAPFLFAAMMFTAYSYFARQSSAVVVPGYEVGGSIWEALRTFVTQLFTPIPGSSLFFHNEYANFIQLGNDPTKAELVGAAWRGFAVFMGTSLILWYSLRSDERGPSSGALERMGIVGVLLWTLPVMIISLAPKYQLELAPGKGHLPAIMQVFGWALVIAAVSFALVRVASRRSRAMMIATTAGIAAVLGFGAAVDGYVNMRVVALEAPITATRGLLESSLEHGLLEPMPDGSIMVFADRDLKWQTGNLAQVPLGIESLLINRTGRRYDGRMLNQGSVLGCAADPASYPPPDCATPSKPAAWVHVRPRREGGTVVLAPVIGVGARALLRGGAKTLRAYTPEAQVPLLGGVDTNRRPWSSAELVWRKVDSGDGWAIFEASTARERTPVASSIFDAGTRLDFTNGGTPAQVVRLFGTKRLLP